MYFRQAAKNTLLVFDNENLISAAGVEPAMRLADAAGLTDLTAAHVHPSGPQAANTPLKIGCLVTGMLMGADSIDDMDLLRDSGLHHIFTEVRAPSTLGSFLRSFDHGTVRQLQAVHRRLLPGLTRRAPLLPGRDVLAYLDVDACQRRGSGPQKQGAPLTPPPTRWGCYPPPPPQQDHYHRQHRQQRANRPPQRRCVPPRRGYHPLAAG